MCARAGRKRKRKWCGSFTQVDFHLDSAFGALTPEQARQRRHGEPPHCRSAWWSGPTTTAQTCCSWPATFSTATSPYGDTAPPAGPGTGALPRSGSHRPRQPRLALTPDGPYRPHALARTTFTSLQRTVCRAIDISGPELRRTRRGLHRPGVSHGQCTSRLPCASRTALSTLVCSMATLRPPGQPLPSPIRAADIAGSGLDYLALGHVHSRSGVLTAGPDHRYARIAAASRAAASTSWANGDFSSARWGRAPPICDLSPLPGAATASPRWMSPMATPSTALRTYPAP